MKFDNNPVLMLEINSKTGQKSAKLYDCMYLAKCELDCRTKEGKKEELQDIHYEVIQLDSLEVSDYMLEPQIEETAQRYVEGSGVIVQVSKYSELCWTYLSVDSDLYSCLDDVKRYYHKLCEDYPDFSYRDTDDGDYFELYYKDELILTLSYVGYSTTYHNSFDNPKVTKLQGLEQFEQFVEKYIGKPNTSLIEDADRKSKYIIVEYGNATQSKKYYGFASLRDAVIGMRELTQFYKQKYVGELQYERWYESKFRNGGNYLYLYFGMNAEEQAVYDARQISDDELPSNLLDQVKDYLQKDDGCFLTKIQSHSTDWVEYDVYPIELSYVEVFQELWDKYIADGTIIDTFRRLNVDFGVYWVDTIVNGEKLTLSVRATTNGSKFIRLE